MCGRFTVNISPKVLQELFRLPEAPALPARFNVAPTQPVPVVRQLADHLRSLELLRWGLIPPWAKDPSIGAR